MNEVQKPKKPLIFYYVIVLLVILFINIFVMPEIARHQIKEVDYGEFMSMTENQEIGEVQVQENQILFTSKDGKSIYKTGIMNDPELTQRLRDSGAKFSSEIIE